jgi:hypothetical protein
MAKFEKGNKRPLNAGRKRGSINKTTSYLKDMILLGGSIGGDLLVEREKIERRSRDATEINSPGSAGPLQRVVEQNGAFAGYLTWLSVEHPTAYAPLLGRVMPLQNRDDSHKDVVYRSVEEIQREIDALEVQMRRLAPLLRNVSSSDSPEDRRRRSWTSRARS